MITTRVLKNIQIQELKDFLSNFKVKGRSTRTDAGSTRAKYSKYLEVIEEELANETGSFTSDDVDEFIFDQLYYSNNNLHYVYQFNGCFITDIMDQDEILSFLGRNSSLNYNLNLTEWDDNTNEINLCTTRAEVNEKNELTSIHMLLRIYGTLDQEYGATSAFCGVRIDLNSKQIILKFNQLQFQLIAKEPTEILDDIKLSLSGQGKYGKQFACLDLNIVQLNEDSVLTTIYNLFAELSLEAEEILNNQMDSSTEGEIIEFLKSLDLHEIKEEYIEQIKAVIYQDISSSMKEQIFDKGWVFKFLFREGDHSRASSNAEKRLPVYSYKAFWQLKELIHSIGKVHDAGFHWNINKTPGKESFVDVRMESRSGTMIVYYYSRARVNRKEKEDYVLQKISQHL